MMFDPPDYPFKELSETLRDQYGPDDFLFTNEIEPTESSSGIHTLAEVTEEMIINVENQLTLDLNEAGKYFNLNNGSILNVNGLDQNTETLVVHTENLFNDSTLLDDSTVNQFLLPLQESSENNKETNSNGPDILALHSCVICHEIFTNDADLLDHTISLHANLAQDQNNNISNNETTDKAVIASENCSNSLDFDAEWLVCSLCERVLSTALEVQPSEQLCCNNASGKSCVSARRLHTMYVCDFCRGLFADADALDRHRLACFLPEQTYEDGVDPSMSSSNPHEEPDLCFKCDVCGIQYSTVEELKAHSAGCQRPCTRKRRPYNNTNTNKMWNCGSCNQLFTTARELYRHKRGEDRPPGTPLLAYACDQCDKVLGSMCALHTHTKMHKVAKPGYPCRVCSRRFNQSGHLAIHMRMHTGERPYPCDLCPKAFKVKVERDDHRRTHTGERPFACAACPKTFTAAARLREHARIHTDQRPYRCEICGAAFRRPYARTVHTLIHTGEKPHECDICGTAFRRSGDMWKHKRTLHGVSLNNDNDTRS